MGAEIWKKVSLLIVVRITSLAKITPMPVVLRMLFCCEPLLSTSMKAGLPPTPWKRRNELVALSADRME